MSKSFVCLVAALVLCAPAAWAGEMSPVKDGQRHLDELKAKIKDPGASFDDRWTAYERVRAAIKKEKEAGKELKNPSTAIADGYAEIQGDVATALRRENLPASAWIMGFFGASLLWGGFAFCLGVARRQGKSKSK